MNIEQRLQTCDATRNKKLQEVVNGNSLANRHGLADSGSARDIDGRRNFSCNDAIFRLHPDAVQDPEEAEAEQLRLRQVIGGNVLESLNTRQLTELHFSRITGADASYWRNWLAFQLTNDRLMLEEGIYRPGPQWAVSLVSMR